MPIAISFDLCRTLVDPLEMNGHLRAMVGELSDRCGRGVALLGPALLGRERTLAGRHPARVQDAGADAVRLALGRKRLRETCQTELGRDTG